jgi:hypothetical protein
VAGDRVALRAAFRGTDTGGYAGHAATARAVDEWVGTIMHFDGDRVVRGLGRSRQTQPVSSISGSSTTRGPARITGSKQASR